MQRFTVQVDPPIAIELWSPQYAGDKPHWHFSIEAVSPDAALAAMQKGDCRGMPMRITTPLG